jgi:hypothetical protein
MGTFEEQKTISTYWMNKSNDLKRAASAVFESGQDDSVFRMLCGMSLEAMFKAVVLELGNAPPTSHNLNQLARDAGLTYSKDDQKLLQILTEAVIWDGRYPVPLKEQHWDELNEIEKECLYDRRRLGNSSSLEILTPNDRLSLDKFLELLNVAADKLFAIATWVIR